MAPLFRSFWHAGFEAGCQINRAGLRLDMLAATQHDVQADEDYRRVAEFGMRTVRESFRWHRIDRGGGGAGGYDFTSARPIAEAARRQGMQVVWTLCHFGWPDDLDLFTPRFVDRFARYARAAARFLVEHGDEAPVIAPINEISFLAWAIGTDGYIQPFAVGQADRVKAQLVRAAIAGIEAVWDVAPRARVVHIDPMIHVVCPRDRPHLEAAAAAKREGVMEAWEMIRGNAAPQLGGHPRYLDVVGVNFYHANECEIGGDRLRWEDEPRDDRWMPLHRLLAGVWHRFQRPVYLGETSHFGAGRARWIMEVADEVASAMALGVPVEGLCVYPIIDRPDWDEPHQWHNSGLWDVRPAADGAPDGRLERVLCHEYAQALRQAQTRISSRFTPAAARDPQMAGS